MPNRFAEYPPNVFFYSFEIMYEFFLQGSSSLVHHTSYSLMIPAPKRRRLECNIQLELDSTYYVEVQQRQCMDECTSSSISSVMAEAEETATKSPKFSNTLNIVLNVYLCNNAIQNWIYKVRSYLFYIIIFH